MSYSRLAADLGCGGGRDAVHLAEVLRARAPGWRVLGLDNHRAALERAQALGRRVGMEGAAGGVDFEWADLRKGGLQAALARRPDEPLRLVHGCRWLDLPLIAELPALLAPGGLLLWSTFLDPAAGEAPRKPPFRRSRRLARGQLRAVVGGDPRMRVVFDAEGELLTRGEYIPAQFFVAARLGPDDATPTDHS